MAIKAKRRDFLKAVGFLAASAALSAPVLDRILDNFESELSLQQVVDHFKSDKSAFYIIPDKQFYEIEAIFMPQARYANTKLWERGIENLLLRGKPLIPASSIPKGTTVMDIHRMLS